MSDDELAIPRAVRHLRNDIRSLLSLLEDAPTRRGWWNALKMHERDIVRCFSELRAEEPTNPEGATMREPARIDPNAFDDSEGE